MTGPTPEYLRRHQFKITSAIARVIVAEKSPLPTLEGLTKAIEYSVAPGGKYVRALLLVGAASASPKTPDSGALDHLVTAIELIHTYSLVHDDLPAMDDDDMRRGKLSLHRAYDEATAVLVGDGLQAWAFELVVGAPNLTPEQKIHMVKVLAQAAGVEGMVGGQYIDIHATGTDMTLEELQGMHCMKTGALIRASLALGGIAANATEEQLAALDDFGSQIGLAFQVADDILDVEGDTATLGKTQGKDAEANKPTYVKLLGLDGAKAEAQRLLDAALAALDFFGESADMLRELARYIVKRDR